MFGGAMVALVTPFSNNRVDEEKIRELVEWQIASGSKAIVPCGTTGESATLSHDEHNLVVETVVKAVNKRVPVIAGTGSNSTEEAILLTSHARESGADGVLMITPYYNKPTQEGLYQHFKKVAESVPIPIILYNVPSRTAINMLPETVARLAEIENIVGIKDASGSTDSTSQLLSICPDKIEVYSGDDAMTLPLLAIGGKGVISTTSNVAPSDMAGLCDAALSGDFAKARKLHYKLLPLIQAMFVETNPIPVKTAVAMMGKIGDEFRLPLVHPSEANRKKIEQALKNYGLL